VDNFFSSKFITASFNTLVLAVIAAFLVTLIALILNFNARINVKRSSEEINNFLSMGYAIPGLILAIGITQLLTYLDFILYSTGILLTGSIFGLIFAYIIKSYALSNNVLQSGYKQFSTELDDSARTLGTSKFNLLSKVHVPLLRAGLLTSFLLVISEVVKELPATLILRPFNFDTLAVNVYLLASEERMYEAAFPALFIILIGLIPIYFLSKMIQEANKSNE
jgi:iron(III) transport system permease protein